MEFDLSKKQCFYFNEITKIPHGSKNEKALSDYIVQFAKDHGFAWKQDEVFNVIVEKPAAKGYENSEPVILQAHIDMVCEKNKGTVHDFEKDPLDLYVDEEGWLHARGTTLGADDGAGAAYMLAILDEPDLPAPALQCVFTTMEEIGLLGACQLKAADFHAKRYINLDCENDEETTISCSGGARVVISKKLHYKKNDKPAFELRVRGLKGGHSGGLIHLERGNSILLAARILEEISDEFKDIQLVDFNGGLKFNAIPREADVIFVSDGDFIALQRAVREVSDKIADELRFSDEGFYSELVVTEPAKKAVGRGMTKEILGFLTVMPNGFQHKSMVIDGLTVASLNAGVAHIEKETLYIDDLLRSAAASHGDTMIRQLKILSKLFNFDFKLHDRYYGWDYEPASELREILRRVLHQKGIELQERSTHGGLECGIFKGMIPDLDIITYGPMMEGIHTPEEKLDLASFDRAYDTLLKVLEECR